MNILADINVKIVRHFGLTEYNLLGRIYNMTYKMTEEHKRKIGLANKIALKGKKQSEESKRKRSLKLKGRKVSTGMLGKKHSEETKRKIAMAQSFEKGKNWKGDKVKYRALHNWVEKIKGKPRYCESCKKTDKKRYEWANISKKYKRDINDWYRLCKKCHCKFDKVGTFWID